MADQDRWRHVSGILSILQTIALVFSVFLLREQIKDIENSKSSRSADYVLRLDDRFDKEPYSGIKHAIENDKPLLKAQGGKFTEEDLEGYLDIFETMNDIYEKGLISQDMLLSTFSYDLQKTYDNVEVQNYLKERVSGS